jgi:MFS family permease
MFSKAKVMLWSQTVMGASAAGMAVTTYLDVITPALLLSFGIVLGVGMAFNLPAWQSIVPDLVPRGMVASAVALNSVSFNVARAVGPALGGLILAVSGPALAFGLNTLSYVGVIVVVAALARSWERKSDEQASVGLVISSIGLSLRYARYSPAFRRVLALVAMFGVTTAVIQAVLPNRTSQLDGSEAAYGLLLGAMGVGALIAAFGRTRFEPIRTGAALPYTIVVFGVAGIVIGGAPNMIVAIIGMAVVGGCWILTLTVLNATTQLMTPGWIRGRAMSLYLLAFTGIMPLGSITAGALADRIGAGSAMIWFSLATVALGLFAPAFRIPRLDQVEMPEYERERLTAHPHADDEGGPVMVVNTWQMDPNTVDEFLALLDEVRVIRLRNGAYSWRLYRNTDDPYRLTEVYLYTSWEEHLAQHRRTDDAAAALLGQVMHFDAQSGPLNRHLIAVDLANPPDWGTLSANIHMDGQSEVGSQKKSEIRHRDS